MKKLMALIAFVLIAQTVPVLAQDNSPYGEQYPEKAKKHTSQLMALDPNGDGLITQTEFMSNAKRQFDAMNYNNDDYVDMEEMRRFRVERQEAAAQRREEIKQRRGEQSDNKTGAQ